MSDTSEPKIQSVDSLPQTQIKKSSSISFEGDNATSSTKKAPSRQAQQKKVDESSPSVIAMSNLRCPSPPPILQHTTAQGSIPNSSSSATRETAVSPGPISKPAFQLDSPTAASNSGSTTALGSSSPNSETVPAGGALLKSKEPPVSQLTESLKNSLAKSNGVGSAVSPANGSDGLLDMPAPQHQRTTSMHAHFCVEDILKHPNVRSRSGSASTNDMEAPHAIPPLPQIKPNEIPKPATTLPSAPSDVNLRLPQDDGKLHILFGACGSVSIKKTRLIINKLEQIYKDKVSIQLILTRAAEHFVSRGEFPSNVQIWRDKDEWAVWNNRADPVLHIELRRWADVLVIAPLSANTLSKIAMGLCDNLLTNVVRAWNTQYPIILAPAMVSFAYTSAVTKRHAKTIKEDMKWIEILKPTEKVVSSYGEIGMGGMMDWNEIVDKIVQKLGGYPEDEDEDDDDTNDKNDGDVEEDDDVDDDDDEDDDVDDDDENDAEVSGDPADPPIISGVRKLTVAEEDELSEALQKTEKSTQ